MTLLLTELHNQRARAICELGLAMDKLCVVYESLEGVAWAEHSEAQKTAVVDLEVALAVAAREFLRCDEAYAEETRRLHTPPRLGRAN